MIVGLYDFERGQPATGWTDECAGCQLLEPGQGCRHPQPVVPVKDQGEKDDLSHTW